MFNIENYTTYHFINGLTCNVEINKDKIEQDAEQLKKDLINLEKIIGPFKIKVTKGKVKLKTKDDF